MLLLVRVLLYMIKTDNVDVANGDADVGNVHVNADVDNGDDVDEEVDRCMDTRHAI